jgi:hypothetical protein
MCSLESSSARIADILGNAPLNVGTIPDAGIRSYLVMPTPECVLSPAPLRHVACLALIRLDDATIWLLRTRGAPWSPTRLVVAAQTLQAERTAWQDTEYLTGRISFALEISSVAVLPPVLDRTDPTPWDLRRTAVAMVMRSLRTAGAQVDPTELAAAVHAVEGGLATALDAALAYFRAEIDVEALREATTASGSADITRYNYLVEPPHRAWRLQLARTFPIFVRAAATGAKGSAGETIRTAVDQGVPLVRHLSARWGVSNGAIRSLLRVDVATIGGHWDGNVRGLVKVLDALRPEDRPKRDSADWPHFNRAVAVAERLFRCPAWTSALAQSWLRGAARRGWADLDDEAAQDLWNPAAIAAVQRFRDSLARFLALEFAHQPDAPLTVSKVAFDSVADQYVSTRQPRRLSAIAARFESDRLNLRSDLVQQSALLSGEGFWPLFPGDVASADGTRVIRPLTSRMALNRHGAALNNCLEDVQLESFVAECMEANCFILGILEGDGGRPISTAEVRISRQMRGARLEPHVVQHTGNFNAPPSSRCRHALAEALASAKSDAVQQHLEAGLLAARQRRLLGNTRAKEEAERMLLTEALGQTLGPSVLEGLSAAARTRLHAYTVIAAAPPAALQP